MTTIKPKSKTLVIPEGILQGLNALAKGLGSIYLGYGQLRTILTHLDNGKFNTALNFTMVKTQWSLEVATGFLHSCEDELRPFLQLQKLANASNLKQLEIDRNINHYANKCNMLRDIFWPCDKDNPYKFHNSKEGGFFAYKGFGELQTVAFTDNSDLCFDSSYEDYIEASQLLYKERQRAVAEL